MASSHDLKPKSLDQFRLSGVVSEIGCSTFNILSAILVIYQLSTDNYARFILTHNFDEYTLFRLNNPRVAVGYAFNHFLTIP